MGNVPIKKWIEKIPGGMMVVPLFLGIIFNTISQYWYFVDPKTSKHLNFFEWMGGFTGALWTKPAFNVILALFMFLIGSQISFKLAPVALKKAVLLLSGKFIVGAGIGWLVVTLFGDAGFLGISSLAVFAALTNANGGLYASLSAQYGDETDVGAYSLFSLKDGPFFTLIALGALGGVAIPIKGIVATVLPMIVGMILGNLDDEMRKFLGSSKLLLIPFFAFPLGIGIKLQDLATAGLPGVLLGLIAVGTAVGPYILYRIFKQKEPLITWATGSTAGNAVATPLAVAAIVPAISPELAKSATVQVAAACITSAIVCPLVVGFLFKKYRGVTTAKE